MSKLPPLDTHSHIAAEVSGSDLEQLGAVTLIATKSATDYQKVASRKDLVSVWGVGCHPSLVRVQNSFDKDQFEEAILSTSYVAEVGLDGDSRVPMDRQKETLRSILKIIEQHPRIISLHSYKATSTILSLLAEHRHEGIILHWWLGGDDETMRAVDLGYYFSINYSMVRANDVWKSIPLDRILFETDHPFGDRFSSKPRQPGRIQDTETIVAKWHKISEEELRLQAWRNFAHIVSRTGTHNLLPKPIQRMIDHINR